MKPEGSPAYEIGHFHVEDMPRLFSPGVKYIVSLVQERASYVLHADDRENIHLGVAIKAGIDPSAVIGGGNIAWSSKGVDLRGYSHRFKQEPDEIRAVFNRIINDFLREKIERFKEARRAARTQE